MFFIFKATRVALLEKLKKNQHFTRSTYFALEISKKKHSYPNCCSNYHRGGRGTSPTRRQLGYCLLLFLHRNCLYPSSSTIPITNYCIPCIITWSWYYSPFTWVCVTSGVSPSATERLLQYIRASYQLTSATANIPDIEIRISAINTTSLGFFIECDYNSVIVWKNSNRLPSQIRPVNLFAGRVKRISICVQDHKVRLPSPYE